MTFAEAQYRAGREANSGGRERPLALTGLHIWDGLAGGTSSQRLTIRIEGDRIADVGSGPHLQADASLIRLDSCYAMPGLIDGHVHLCLDPTNSAAPIRDAEEEPDARAAIEARAQAMLRAGITTARDLGGGSWHEMELRDRIDSGVVSGPRLLCAGQPLTTPAGHCHFWGGEVHGLDEAQRLIDRQVERGVDWIKIMATGGVLTAGSTSAVSQFDRDFLGQVVEMAGARGLPVAAHCHGTAGIRAAAEAGVRSVEHCSFASAQGFGSDFDPAVAALLAERGVWVSPTVNVGWGRRIEADGAPTAFFGRMARCLRGLLAAGVRMLASTDAGIPGVEHHRLPEALVAFARYADLEPVEVLRCATSGAAEALGRETHIGVIRPGAWADLIVFDSDPLLDLDVLRTPRLVLSRGRPVRGGELADRPDTG